MNNIWKKRIGSLLLLLGILCLAGTIAPARAEAAKAKWVKSSGKWKYRQSNKKYVKSKFKKISKKYYYFDSNGYVQNGWIKMNGYYYYGTRSSKSGESGMLKGGWTKAKKSGNYYYFDTTGKAGSYGRMAVGWKKIGKKYFYFNSNGIMATGWKEIDGFKYYFAPTGGEGKKGAAATGFTTIDGKVYGFKESGKLGEYARLYRNEWGTDLELSDDDSTMGTYVCHFNAKGVMDKKSKTKQEFVDYIKKVARKDSKKSGIRASVTAAQAILESGYGQSRLALEGNNLFGIKASKNGLGWKNTTWKGKIYTAKTGEYLNGKNVIITDDFRAYESWAESIADHSAYLANAMNGSKLRYKGVVDKNGAKTGKWKKSAKATLKLIKSGGYATDPGYVSTLMSIIKRYKLTSLDKK